VESAQCLCLSFDTNLIYLFSRIQRTFSVMCHYNYLSTVLEIKFEFNGPNKILEFIYIYIYIKVKTDKFTGRKTSVIMRTVSFNSLCNKIIISWFYWKICIFLFYGKLYPNLHLPYNIILRWEVIMYLELQPDIC
jgi:hypothetical protein